MKRYLILAILLVFATACGRPAEKKVILVKINNYEITKEEFEEQFKESASAKNDTLQARKEFLDNLINRVLVLQDSEKKGLDKDKSFLKMVQRFWEQSLLKLALDRKTRQIAGSFSVSDKTIEETYNKLRSEGKVEKPYHETYKQIKWEITKLKEANMLGSWIDELRKKSDIKINYDLLQTKK